MEQPYFCKMKFVAFFTVCLFATSCSNNAIDTSIRDIKSLESNSKLKNSDSLINSYIRFADANPKHDSATVFLMNAAHICVTSSKVAKGARIYERIANEYAGNAIVPQALINGGIAFATIPDPANAKRLYDQFIALYPTHPRIEEVKKWSEYSGLTDEELFRRFEARLNNTDSI
jgi:outer membrane PBP1 activator LpoA protein